MAPSTLRSHPCHPNSPLLPPLASPPLDHCHAALISLSGRGTSRGFPLPCLLLGSLRQCHLCAPRSSPCQALQWKGRQGEGEGYREEGWGQGATKNLEGWWGLDLGVWGQHRLQEAWEQAGRGNPPAVATIAALGLIGVAGQESRGGGANHGVEGRSGA